MMQTKTATLKKIALAITVLVGLFGPLIRLELRAPVPAAPEPVPLEKLLAPSLSEQEIYDRLEKSAEGGAPISRDLAVGLSRSPSVLLRQGAARVIGSFTDQFAREAHERLLADPTEIVHLEALRSLGKQPAPWREAYVDRILSGPGSKTQELYALSSLARIAASPGRKSEAVGRMVSLVQTSTDQVFQNTAFLEALGSGGEDPRVLGLCRSLLEHGSDIALMRVALQHLLKRKDRGGLPLIGSLSRSPAASLREEAVSGIHVLCPPDRWSLLAQRLEGDPDAGVRRAAIREVARLAEREGIDFLKRMQARGFIRPAERPQTEATLKYLIQSVSPACSP